MYRFPSPHLPVLGGMSVMLKKQKNPSMTQKAAEAYKTKCEADSMVVKAWMPAIMLLLFIFGAAVLALLGIDPAVMAPIMAAFGIQE